LVPPIIVFIRIELFCHGGVVCHISKKHGHQLALPFDGASVIEDLVRQMPGCIGLGLVVVDRKSFLGLIKIVTTLIAKVVLR